LCFIKYETRDECVRAISALHGKWKDKDSPQMIQVRFAQTKMEKEQQKMQQMQPFMYGMGMPGMGDMGMMGWQGYADPYGNGGFAGMPMMGDMSGMGMMGFGGMGGYQNTQPAKGPPGANLFVYGIPDTYKDSDLASLFRNFGTIVSAKVQVDLATGRSKGFGFVSFDNASTAQTAISHMDGFMLQGKKLNVRVKKGAEQGAGGNQTGQRFAPY
jgi:RNA recognition motif-containing protein